MPDVDITVFAAIAAIAALVLLFAGVHFKTINVWNRYADNRTQCGADNECYAEGDGGALYTLSMICLRDKLSNLRESKDHDTESQRQTVTASSRAHQRRMIDMKTDRDQEMAKMRQNKLDETPARNTKMAEMNARTQKEMGQRMADHNATMAAMRYQNDVNQSNRNARVNSMKLANAQRPTNIKLRVDAQCSNLKQRQCTDEVMHSLRTKVLSFSRKDISDDARARNAPEKFDATNARHCQDIEDMKVRHGQEMKKIRTESNAAKRKAKHKTNMTRTRAKNVHRTEDMNFMTLNFVSLERIIAIVQIQRGRIVLEAETEIEMAGTKELEAEQDTTQTETPTEQKQNVGEIERALETEPGTESQ